MNHRNPDIYVGKRELETRYDYDVYPDLSPRKARLYDSDLGRFMQVNPHWEKYTELNGYSGMVGNSKFLDRQGLVISHNK